MASRFFAIFMTLGLVGALADVARSEVQEIEAGGEATFRWSASTGPVDHYEVQVATEPQAPFDWKTFRRTAPDELSVSISGDSVSADGVGSQLPDVAHWAFDENSGSTASDSSGNGHTGNAFGAQWSTDTPTGSGSSLSFNGSSEGVRVGWFPTTGQSLTIAMWFKADDFGIADARLISKAAGSAEDDHYWMLSTVDSNGMKLRFRLKTDGVTKTLIGSAGTILPGVWTHVAAVYDGATMRLFQDGVQVGITSKNGYLTPGWTVHAAIGNQPSGEGAKAFDGLIDDVRIYSAALSQPEVASTAAGTGSGASFVTVRTIAHNAFGGVSLPSAVSPTVHFVSPSAPVISSVANDFDGDSVPDVIAQNANTGTVVLESSATGQTEQIDAPTVMSGYWENVAQGDFDGDGREDIFWRHKTVGVNRVWLEVGPNVVEGNYWDTPELAIVAPEWKVLASGDFDGDGFSDLFWQNENTFETFVWFMEGFFVDVVDFPRLRSASWVLEATADFDASGTSDIFWRDSDSGRTALWLFDGDTVEFESLETADPGLEVADTVDYDDDGSIDMIWEHEDGSCEIWLMPDGERLADITCPAVE